jgi:CheY-like chemotaxis protein
MRQAVSASILVADDEPNIVLSLEFLLKQAGFRVRTVLQFLLSTSFCTVLPISIRRRQT